MNSHKSKFAGLIDALGQSTPPVIDAARAQETPAEVEEVPPALALEGTEAKRRGRPTGKRTDPAFDQVTAYIRKDTYRRVKIALLQQENGQEFSELVESLLVEWLNART